MSNLKQVKVDNWGVYFLQRLKHFFNRTDYCDLTLQFQDNAQLKVHRLVLSACTEYFELLERTCEMYEDCLVMPDDLQADVVVPIVNFMYTGQLEFKMELLDKLYQTSQIMNMPVLTKLLDAQRVLLPKPAPTHSYSGIKRYSKTQDLNKQSKPIQAMPSGINNSATKRSYGNISNTIKDKKRIHMRVADNGVTYLAPPPMPLDPVVSSKKLILGEPRPTRYELPEELDADNIFDSSFTNISYTSKPLMVHPETVKRYSSKRSGIFTDSPSAKRFMGGQSTVDIVECKKITRDDNIFDDHGMESNPDESEFYETTVLNVKEEYSKNNNQLFDQILEDNVNTKVTFETKDNKQSNNIDHAKIISEVLKKYPHLVKSNKNIKLKILNTSNKSKKQPVQQPSHSASYVEEKKDIKTESDSPDYTYETDVLDSKEAAKLISMGAENVRGPWICLICGTPGKALHFRTYYKFRRHLVEVHNEKPVANICEYCGLKSLKRNYLLHHLYTKHGIEPPPQYHFPKCNICNYVALTEGFLVKHKMTHTEGRNFRCNVCPASFSTSKLLLQHIQKTGHKYSADRKTNLQCIYCLKVFLREANLYAHLKTNHKHAAKTDGIIDDSDEEEQEEEKTKLKSDVIKNDLKYELPITYESEYDENEMQYQIEQRPDGNIHVISKKPIAVPSTSKQKILNSGFSTPVTKTPQKLKTMKPNVSMHSEYYQDVNITSSDTDRNEEIIMIGDTEYIMKDNQLIPRKTKSPVNDEYIIPNVIQESDQTSQLEVPSTSIDFTAIHNTRQPIHHKILKKSSKINQPIQIVVSNEEEYKALMSSNHSIIFDDGDTNKTLTVLTTPHSSSLETTTIDLNNTQSNDMMIIQEDYSINASEAVSTDNSNIVVVYSHPVNDHDQNKEYQLITSQHIEGQFVQPSAVLTQSYETVTTSASVINTEFIATEVGESWPNIVQQNTQPIAESPETQVQSIPLPNMEVISEAQPENTVIRNVQDETKTLSEELPEVQLLPAQSQSLMTQVDQTEGNPEESNITNTENLNQNRDHGIVTEGQNNTPLMVVHTQSETVMETETLLPNKDVIEEKNMDIEPAKGNDTVYQEVIVEQNHSTQVDYLEENISQKTLNTDVTSEVMSSKPEEPNSSQEHVEIIQMNDEKVKTVIVKEQIQNLTSEWSEDEDEIQDKNDTAAHEKSSTVGDNIEYVTEDVPLNVETRVEIEESIENIQQEVEKQIIEEDKTIEVKGTENEPDEDHLSSLHEPEQSQSNIVITNNVNNTEKISSLLNDWDENDSQEESTPMNENESNLVSNEDTDINTQEAKEDAVAEKRNATENDNIKSLVSDWDDEEEENKD